MHEFWVASVVIVIKKSKKVKKIILGKSFFKEEKCFNKSKIFNKYKLENSEDGKHIFQ